MIKNGVPATKQLQRRFFVVGKNGGMAYTALFVAKVVLAAYAEEGKETSRLSSSMGQ